MFQTGRHRIDIDIVHRHGYMYIGVIPAHGWKLGEWLGYKQSWSFRKNGDKRHLGEYSLYSTGFGSGDSIGVLLDFERHTIELVKNDANCGVAFDNLVGSVRIAVSMGDNDDVVSLVRID